MTFRKGICVLLAVLIVVGVVGLVMVRNQSGDQKARLAEMEAQLADAQAKIDQYYPYFEAQVVAEYDGGFIFRDDVMPEYEYYESMYSQYGMSLTGTAYETQIKQNILRSAVSTAVQLKMADTLGLELTAEEIAQVEADANETLDRYVEQYGENFAEEGMSDEEVRQAVIDYLESNEYGYNEIYNAMYDYARLDAVYAYAVKDVVVTEEEVQAAYDADLAADEEAYAASSYDYETARNNGETILWNPEGYRTVKQVLIAFDDDQTARYKEITARISSLEAELEEAKAAPAATEAPETTEEPDAAGTAEATVSPKASSTPEATLAPENTDVPEETVRAVKEIQADLDAANAELDALYDELMPKAQEVVKRFEAGDDIDTLIAEYGEDPGMTQEPGMTTGYYVCKNYTPWQTEENTRVSVWDSAFTAAAASVDAVGEISEPTRGSYGFYIVYYLADVPAGAVPLEEVHDAILEAQQAEKTEAAYNDQVNQWMEEASVTYYLDRF